MDKFANLPTPMKWFLGATGLGVVFGVGGPLLGWTSLLIFALILLGLLILCAVGYLLWSRWQRKKQDAALGDDLQQSSTAAPGGMSATDIATLDSLRKKFQEGLEAFRSRGKDLYSLPWYVIIGEPGSGKTEAIRHCNVGFPPGMHEGENEVGYMGAGGTINMNWWFTNYAVVLDTAGRLVFEKVKPGETSEWKEFLRLLKKNRPHCPINGLFLAIPSDSLIKDSADQIAAKAGKIAQQLDVIQRILDFRFPVYVTITKSDKINGFREFFETVTDPQLQHQMMGWSNPESLDSAFKPELVDQYLTQVAERLRRRRLGLMLDPTPESAPRRIDEVDTLYTLPNSLLMLGPRLRKYLETIFMPGQWSSKPLFLRGIYFTSSMREGAALDDEVAKAMGVPLEELPEGKVWERERAYFLKDIFMEKVFKEKGLVTRATNTKSLLLRRQLILYAACFMALAVFITLAWIGARTFQKNLGDRTKYWAAAQKRSWNGQAWNYPIFGVDPDGNYVTGNDGSYSLATNLIPLEKEKLSVGEFHQKLREFAEKDIKGSWLLPGFASGYNRNSKSAQRIVFETGVLVPLKDAVAQRAQNAHANELYLSDALVALISLESDILSHRSKAAGPSLEPPAAANFLGRLVRFACNANALLDTNLAPVMLWTYNTNQDGLAKWPPAWLSSTVTNAANATNPVLMAGLDHFIGDATNNVQVMATNWSSVEGLITALREYEKNENDLFVAVAAHNERDADACVDRLLSTRTDLDGQLGQCAKLPLFTNGLSLAKAYETFTNKVTVQAIGAFDKVKSENAKALALHQGWQVFKDIKKRLDAAEDAIHGKLAERVPPTIRPELDREDRCFLAGAPGAMAYQLRGNVYKEAQALSARPASSQAGSRSNLMGQLNACLGVREHLNRLAGEYHACLDTNLVSVAAYYVNRANRQTLALLSAYRDAAKLEVNDYLRFPLLSESKANLDPARLDSVCQSLQSICADLARFRENKLNEPEGWNSFASRITNFASVAQALKGAPDKPNNCAISLCKMATDLTEDVDAWRGSWLLIRIGNEEPHRSSGEDTLGKVDIRDRVELKWAKDLNNPQYEPLPGTQWQQWGPLRLLFEAKERKPLTNKIWEVVLANPAYKGRLRLRLEFDQPLPTFDDWPKQ